MRDFIGRTLDHYRIVEKVGEGGRGEVFLTSNERHDRELAIKVLQGLAGNDPNRGALLEEL